MKRTAPDGFARMMVLSALLAVYFLVICFINFSAVPSFYDGDMYCDYRYAMVAWEHKSLFPEGWVFGNQLNAVSTPVLAALLYGLSGNLNASMAAACVMMGILVVISYDWMVKTVLQEKESRLTAIILLVTVTLFSGCAVHGNQGWTLLFTMCSYYAGYSITAFLAFGCYLRGFTGSFKRLVSIFPLTCILSFGTGIQSIRQTAIMIGPILGVEFLRRILSPGRWKSNKTPLLIAGGITISNFLGLLYVRMREVNQNQIFGEIRITPLAELKQAAIGCFALIKDLLGADHPEAFFLLAGIGILCLASLVLILKKWKEDRDVSMLVLALLMGASVAVIVVIDVFTTMYVRPRYYFMLYPLIGFLIAALYARRPGKMRWCLFALVVAFSCVAGARELPKVCMSALKQEDEVSHAISDYLLENGYTTVYAEWNHGHAVAIASNGRINTGYWYVEEQPFEKVTHLCSLDIYEADPAECVYLFEGGDDAEIGITVAESAGVQLTLLAQYPETDTYLYTAPENLMQLMADRY